MRPGRTWTRLILVASTLSAALAGAFLVNRLVRNGTAALSGAEQTSLFFVGLILLLTPLNLRRLEACAELSSTLPRAYWSLALTLYGSLFLASIFGTEREVEIRFLAHFLGADLAHRLLLLFPEQLFFQLRKLGTTRAFRFVELILVNLLLAGILGEGSLRMLMLADSQYSFLNPNTGYADRKLSAPQFGELPNQGGFNDREVALEKAPGSDRIAVIGDSFVVGFVPRQFGFVSQLETQLLSQRNSLEFLNFGVMGSEPIDYLEILQHEVLTYQPDRVLLGFYVGNDVKRRRSQLSPLYKEWYVTFRLIDWLRHGQRAGRKFSDLTRMSDQSSSLWLDESRIPPVWNKEEFLRQSAKRTPLFLLEPDTRMDEAWQTTFELLMEFKEACDRRGLPFAVVILPDRVQVDLELQRELVENRMWDLSRLNLSRPQEELVKLFQKADIRHIDLLPHFREHRDSDRQLFLPNDSHLSPRGNTLAAQVVAAWMAETGWE